MNFYKKYIKYKNKYLYLKNQIAGANNEDCPICFNKLNCEPNEPDCEPKPVIGTNCEPISHEFHESCLASWCECETSKTCPYCRGNISNVCDSIYPPFSFNEYVNAITNLNANSNMDEIMNRNGTVENIISNILNIKNLPDNWETLKNVSNVFQENDDINENYELFNIIVNKLHLYQLYNQYILPLDTKYNDLPEINGEKEFPEWNLDIIIDEAIKNQDIENFDKIETFVVEPYKLSGKIFEMPIIIIDQAREPNEVEIEDAYWSRNIVPQIVHDELEDNFYPKSTNEELNEYLKNNIIKGYKRYDEKINKSEFFRIIDELRSINTIIIPNFVSIIGKKAFYNSFIKQIIFLEDSRLTTIQSYAFSESPLENINIPNSVTTIGKNAFDGCSLESIIIPNSVTKIGNDAFYINLDEDEDNPLSNVNLTEVTIPIIFERKVEEIFGDTSLLNIIFTS